MTRPLRALYLSFHFPPLGGAGVQRAAKFVKYLPAEGVEPIVLTAPADARAKFSPRDASLVHDVPDDVRIERVSASTWETAGAARRALRRLLGRPAPGVRAWVDGCIALAARRAPEWRADVVLVSMAPFETARAGARLSERLRIPWVADLRDPWALDEMLIYPTRWHRRRELARMRRSIAGAARVIMNTPEAARALVGAFPEFGPERVTNIPNGFDAGDFAGPSPVRDDGRFRIVHAGHLHTRLGLAHRDRGALRRRLGGERVPVDILARSHVYLLRALEQWLLEDPSIRDRVEVVLAGEGTDEDRRATEASPARALVRFEGYLAHKASVALLRSADLLFLPMHGLPRGERCLVVPGKTYEYLAARRPILAAVPEGDARDLLIASGAADVCWPNDVEALGVALRRRFAAFLAGERGAGPDAELLRRFERCELTRRLAETLRAAIAEGSVSRRDA